MDIDRIKPLAEGMKEEEDGEVEENRDAINQAFHLKSGKAVKEICAHSATFVRCGTRL